MARDDQTDNASQVGRGASEDQDPSPEREPERASPTLPSPSERDPDLPADDPTRAEEPDEPDEADDPDDPNDPELAPPSSPTLARVPPVEQTRGRVGSRLSGQPFAVYGVLAAGAVVLLTLLMIIWFSSDGDDDNDGPICTDTTANDAIALIQDGTVGQISIAYPPADESEIDSDLELPALLRLDLTDGNCRNLIPQGPSGELGMYTVFGAAEWYNLRTGQRQIELDIAANDNIPESILATVTPTPAPTLPVTETPETPASPVALVPTETPTPAPTPTPTDAASPEASPAASPIV